jgi:hypothetical protein
MKLRILPLTFGLSVVPALALAQYAQPQPYGQPPPYGQPHGQPPLQAGGLTPPSSQPYDPYAPQPSPTERQLERAEREDSGRGLEFFYINVEGGVEHLGLQTFRARNLVDAGTVETTQTGPVIGAGLGLRLVFLTLGPRFRIGLFPDWQLWTLNGELGLRIPIGNVEPYFTLGGGYASVGAFSKDNVGGGLNSDNVDITGYNVRGGFGLDLYLSDTFSIGANLTGEVLFLTRPGVDPSKLATAGGTTSDVYRADGSSIGSGVTVTGVLGLHF